MTVLSIIIPNFNSGNLLEDSLNSIFQVPVSFPFEVLIMDNCSSDYPEETIKKFPFDNLFFFSEPDLGIYDAMNKGIKRSNGVWIYFLGAGDKVSIQILEKEIINNRTKQGIIYGDIVHTVLNKNVGGEFDLFRLLRINICQQGILYSTSVFEKFSEFSLKYPILSDYCFNLKLFFDKETSRVYANEIFCFYRGGGVSESKKDHVFNSDKNKIIFSFLLDNLNFESLIAVLKYYRRYLYNKIKILIVGNSK